MFSIPSVAIIVRRDINCEWGYCLGWGNLRVILQQKGFEKCKFLVGVHENSVEKGQHRVVESCGPCSHLQEAAPCL